MVYVVVFASIFSRYLLSIYFECLLTGLKSGVFFILSCRTQKARVEPRKILLENCWTVSGWIDRNKDYF